MSQYHFNFLMKVLQATEESKGDAEVVYALLSENTDQLDRMFAESLRLWGLEKLEKKADRSKFIAANIANFSSLIQQFPFGDQAINMEIAITGYEVALTFYTKEAFPQQWATLQMNLGTAYKNRILKDKAKNIDDAIAAYEDALSVFTREAFPMDWAMIQDNLGIAYRERINGDKADNIDRAIASQTNALIVFPQEAFPTDWATTQNNLGNTYRDRIRGDKADNLENAIASSYKALTVFTQEAFPIDWAMTQDNLGNVYCNRILGEKAENIENAIASYNNTLKIYTREALPQDWASTLNNLGIAYRNRIEGEKSENIENAIAAYNAALTVRTKKAFPIDWATLQNNLGTAYSERINGDKAKNIEDAIAAYKAALTIRTKEAFPIDWAMTQNNLGIAYRNRIKGEKSENIENAISAYKNALTITTKQAFPQEYTETLFNLGIVYQDAGSFDDAYNTYKFAIATVELLRGKIISSEESKRKQAEKWNELYQYMVEVCLQLGNIEEAIEYVERSKTRNLVEQILERDSKTIFLPDVVTQLEKYRDEINVGQYKIQNSKAENPKVLAQHLQELRQQRNELQNRYLPVGSGFRFDQFQPTLGQHTAIIEWYITNQKILAFVVKPNGEELTTPWQSKPEDREALANWVNEYLQDYDKPGKNQWRDKLDERLNKLSEILHLESILDQIPEEQYDRLILIPHRFLHLLPLHALPVGDSYLLDRFSQGVGYAPSCQLLQQLQQRERPNFQSLFAIQNPTGDLQFTDQEVNSILSLFPSHQVLSNSKATKAALDEATPHLQEVNYLHFSCHGSFNPDSPFLLLANAEVSSIPTDADPKQYLETSKGIIDLSKCLTLGNLFEQGFDLNKCRLVVLSACETGLIDFNNSSDEYIGLPSGFLYAGSSSVLSSLWTVDDMSTAYLMIKFVQNLKAAIDGGEDVSVAVALNQAQDWLRNITWKDLEKWANNLQLDSSNNCQIERSMRQMREILAKNARSKKIDKKPFQSPYHWAGFTAIGR